MVNWKCLIVDDEDVDRLMVVSFVKRFPEFQIVAICKSASEALQVLSREHIDVLFLDIDMPGQSGIELRKHASHVRACVFISGHAEYAVETFELDTLDFIVKPVRFDRFNHAMQRVIRYLEMCGKSEMFDLTIGADSLTIKEGHEQTKVRLSDILYLEALKDYTLLVTTRKKHCIWSNIGSLLKQSPFDTFTRIHKSYAVRKEFVTKLNSHEVVVNHSAIIPVGRSFKENLAALL